MVKKYIVTLTAEELGAIDALTHKGRVAARKLMRARILQQAHEGETDEAIADSLQTSVPTIERIRQRFVLGGLDWALSDEPRSGAPRKLDGKQQAWLVALACSTPPSGRECWTMQLLADRLLELYIAEPPLSDETVRRVLKKTNSSPGCVRNGAFQPSAPNSSGAWKMCWSSMPSRMRRSFQWCALTSDHTN
jgi:transposase